MFVLVVCLCPSSVHVVATFPGTVLFPLLCSVLQFLPNTCTLILFFAVSNTVNLHICIFTFVVFFLNKSRVHGLELFKIYKHSSCCFVVIVHDHVSVSPYFESFLVYVDRYIAYEYVCLT